MGFYTQHYTFDMAHYRAGQGTGFDDSVTEYSRASETAYARQSHEFPTLGSKHLHRLYSGNYLPLLVSYLLYPTLRSGCKPTPLLRHTCLSLPQDLCFSHSKDMPRGRGKTPVPRGRNQRKCGLCSR